LKAGRPGRQEADLRRAARFDLTILAVAVWTVPALAIDGVIEINQTVVFVGGNLTCP
jgi:hypothetical protein